MKKLIFILILLSVTPAFAGKKAGVGAPAEPCYPAYNIGETYTQTDAATGMNLWVCKSNDSLSSWAQISGTGGTVSSVSGTVNQIDVATGSTTPVASLDPAIILPGSIRFGATTTSVINGCGGYSDFWIQHKNGTCTAYPAATSSATDIAAAARTAIAAMVSYDKFFYPCAKAAFANTLPTYPAGLTNVSILPSDGNCPWGVVYTSGPAYTITNVAEDSSNVVTLTVTVPASNALAIEGDRSHINLTGLTTATWLNNQDVDTLTASGATITFTDLSGHGTYASAGDTGTTTLTGTLGGATWTWNDQGATAPCMVNPTGANWVVQGLTLDAVGINNYGCQLGSTVTGGTAGWNNFTGVGLTMFGSSDNLFTVAATVSGKCFSCNLFSQWDNTKFAITTVQFDFYDSVLYANGAFTSGTCDFSRNANVGAQGGIGGASSGSGKIRFFNSRMKVASCSGSTHSATNFQITGGVTVEVFGGVVENSGGTQPAVMVNSSTGGHSGNFHITANTVYPVGTIYGSANDDGSSYYWDYQGIANALTVYSTPSASVNASIGATTMYTTPNDGVNHTYQYRWAADLTVIGTSCVGNTTLGTSVIYQDPNAAAPQTVTAQAPITIALGGNGTLGGLAAQGTFTIVVKPNTAVQYSTTFSAGASCSPAPKYQIYPSLTFIN